jgi:hypothetical protein
MATTITYLPGYETGSDLKFPVIIKSLYPPEIYQKQGIVQDSAELAIGDLAILDTSGYLDQATDAAVVRPVIILDTVHNKAVLEGHGTTVTKLAQYTADDVVDYALLLPGMIVSVKVSYAGTDEADFLYGAHVKIGHTPTHVEVSTLTHTDIGYMLADCVVGNTLKYAAMVVI